MRFAISLSAPVARQSGCSGGNKSFAGESPGAKKTSGNFTPDISPPQDGFFTYACGSAGVCGPA
ncbi:putative lipoprotein [Serratia plymuthica A30]|nr:putative lipoprotein [Serratia plymuthica A30]